MFEIVLHRRVKKAYERLPLHAARLITRAIDALARDPYSGIDVRPLHGELKELYRLRVGSYRIVYHVDVKQHVVVVDALGSRGSVY